MTGTITRKPSVDVAQEQKPTGQGYWRNRWKRGTFQGVDDNMDGDLCTPQGDGSWLGAGHWETREAAEARARADLEWNASEIERTGNTGTMYEYLGPVFFPEGGEQ